ncbi:MAG: hypothetical protein CM15mP49_18260 [Actinomycetota bacterium]|nr:MAG: hypothetical protein CM15mP49_18260 [Actinomycetota bacterium]
MDRLKCSNWLYSHSFPQETVASGEIRGGAPATRDFALLDPTRLVDQINAVVLSGGSAFGLSACSGVMEFLEEANIGFNTSAGKVPIVVGLSLFDLGSGSSTVRPGTKKERSCFSSIFNSAIGASRSRNRSYCIKMER